MREETWRPVPGFEGLYDVSDMGRVRGLDRVITRRNGAPIPIRGTVLRPSRHRHGYPMVMLKRGDGTGKSDTVHSLVMAAFAPPRPPGMECLHGPGGNTDNRYPENLRWGTRSENMIDRHRDGTNTNAKLTDAVVAACRQRYAAGENAQALADEHGVHHAVMWRAVTRRSWVHVP